MQVEVTQADRELLEAITGGNFDFKPKAKAERLEMIARHRIEATRALLAEIASYKAAMPTVWEDPAGKGYFCYERPMTPAEAKEAVERLAEVLAENAALRAALEPFAAGPCLCGEIYRASSVAVCHSCKARAALQHKEPQG